VRQAFRAFGAELAVTYLNDKAKKYVEPLARELEAPILMPLDVRIPGQMELVFERIAKDWGKLDFVVHSIAFSPKEALQGRVVDVSCEGFLTTMEVSCWTFIRMAHLAEPLMRKGGTLFTMTYYGSQMVVKNYNIMGVAKARGAMPPARAGPLIPNPIDQNPWAHWRSPMDMIRQGWSTSLFHAAQQWSTRSS